MRKNRPLSLKKDRRRWLQTSATALGATLLPSQLTTAQNKAGQVSPKLKLTNPESAARFFTRTEYALVEELTETIIPADSHSGGAKAAKVADFIEQVVGESISQDEKTIWKEGLSLIDVMSQRQSGKSFIESSPEQRIAVLTILSDSEEMRELPEVRFFHELKELTVRGYYTSRTGILEELQYKGNTVLEEFVGCDERTDRDH